MFWFLEGMCFLPTFLVIWSSCTFLIPYIIAVLKRHVDVILPYISDTGAAAPESCIFGAMTAITAFASMLTIFTRYKYVQKIQEVVASARPRLNQAALWFGLISCLGMCIVGTFPVRPSPTEMILSMGEPDESINRPSASPQPPLIVTAIHNVHDTGAVVFFVAGVTYVSLQSVISYRTHPHGSSMIVCHARAVIAAVSVVAAFPMIICGLPLSSKLIWDPNEKDYGRHVASTASEWTVAFGFVFFFFSYIQEFKRFTLVATPEILTSN